MCVFGGVVRPSQLFDFLKTAVLGLALLLMLSLDRHNSVACIML